MVDSIIISIVSLFVGYLISLYFHNKSIQKMSKDLVREIIMKSKKEDYDYDDTIRVYQYKTDLKLKLVLDKEDSSMKEIDEPWAINFPDIRAIRQHIHIVYDNSRTDTVLCAYVDSLYLIPFPKIRDDLIINQWQYKIGQIINGSEDFDSALRHAGITVGE